MNIIPIKEIHLSVLSGARLPDLAGHLSIFPLGSGRTDSMALTLKLT